MQMSVVKMNSDDVSAVFGTRCSFCVRFRCELGVLVAFERHDKVRQKTQEKEDDDDDDGGGCKVERRTKRRGADDEHNNVRAPTETMHLASSVDAFLFG